MKDDIEIRKDNEYHPFSYYLEHKLKLFDEDKVLEHREKIIQLKIRNIKDNTLTESQKRLYVLNEMNTSNSSSDNEEKQIEIINQPSISIVDNTSSSLNEGSTNASTLSFIESHQVGDAKKNYWLKYDLIDVKLNNKIDNLDLYHLDGEKYCYMYNNSLNTYYFIQNVHFGNNYIINDETSKEPDYKVSF